MSYEKKYKESLERAKPNGGIVSEDFNEGDGFYKVNLAYLSKEQVEEIESLDNYVKLILNDIELSVRELNNGTN